MCIYYVRMHINKTRGVRNLMLWDASEAILGRWRYAIANPADFKYPREKVLSLAEQQVEWHHYKNKWWTPERLNLFAHVLILRSSFHRGGVNSLRARSTTLVLHERPPIAACLETAVIFETSWPLSNGRAFKFKGGWFERTQSNPHPPFCLRACRYIYFCILKCFTIAREMSCTLQAHINESEKLML